MNIVGDGILVRKNQTYYFLDGAEVTERQYRRRYPERAEAPTLVRNRRQKSVAMAVHPTQVAEASADASAKGVPTEFTDDGRPIFESRGHRKEYMKAYGFFDRDAGYGDQAPQHHRGKAPPPSRVRELAHRLAEKIRSRNESRLNNHDS